MTFNINDKVQISEDVFEHASFDGYKLQELGFSPNTIYYVKGAHHNNGEIYIWIHPEESPRTEKDLLNSSKHLISVLRTHVIKDCESSYETMIHLIENGKKTCPFCEEHNLSYQAGTVYCLQPDHIFTVWEDPQTREGRFTLNDPTNQIIIDGYDKQNFIKCCIKNMQPKIIYSQKPHYKLIFLAVDRMKFYQTFS
jgi:hypothetical protein